MSLFAIATPAPTPKTTNSRYVALLYAGLLIVMALGQLFGFEDFIPLIGEFGLPGGYGTATLVACLLVVSQVFAVPFLVGMQLSPLMRIVSMVAGWAAAGLWLVLTIWVTAMGTGAHSIGFLGEKVPLPPGAWAVFVAVALGVLAAWASWGMWPFGARAKK